MREAGPVGGGWSAGDELPPATRRVSQEQIALYADLSGDRNPLHLDADFARARGLPGTIAHGLLEMAIVADLLASPLQGRGRLVALSCRFSRPLVAGDTITCTARVSAAGPGEVTLELAATSGRGERVLTHGRAVVALAG